MICESCGGLAPGRDALCPVCAQRQGRRIAAYRRRSDLAWVPGISPGGPPPDTALYRWVQDGMRKRAQPAYSRGAGR